MKKVLISAMMGLSLLYAHSVIASNVHHDRKMTLADSSSSKSQAKSGNKSSKSMKASSQKSAKHHGHHHHHKHHAKHHHHKHQAKHHHNHKHHSRKHHKHPRMYRDYNCPDANRMGASRSMSNQVMMDPSSRFNQMENNMDIIDRDHAARAGRGR